MTVATETMSDRRRLAVAFRELRDRGYQARMNFTCCGTCGSYELNEMAAAKLADGKPVINNVFWHAQNERSFDWQGNLRETLWLHRGMYVIRDDGSVVEENPESTAAIVETLRRHDLVVEWTGNDAQCIGVQHKEVEA